MTRLIDTRQWLGPLICCSAACLPLAGCWGTTTPHQQATEVIKKEATHQELLRKGEASAALGDLTRAEQYYVAAIKAGGEPGHITRRLLVVCVADGRYPAALEYANQHLRLHPRDTYVKFAAASIHAALGDTLSARLLLEEVVKERPQWSDAHYALATVLRDQGGSLKRAEVHDLTYLRLEPEGPMAEQVRERLRRGTP